MKMELVLFYQVRSHQEIRYPGVGVLSSRRLVYLYAAVDPFSYEQCSHG